MVEIGNKEHWVDVSVVGSPYEVETDVNSNRFRHRQSRHMDWIDGHPDESETFYTQTITVSQSKLPVVVQPGGWLMEHNGNWMKGAKIVDVRQLLGGNLIITVTEVIERRVHDMGVGKLWFVSGKDQ